MLRASAKGGCSVAHRNVEILIGRLITDETFRAAFDRNTSEALHRFIDAGHELTLSELAALTNTPRDVWDRAASRIDKRLQKVSLEP